MIVICVIDDHGGMLFNHRRQSQDRVLRKRILQRTQNKKLWMNAYSYGQFVTKEASPIVVSEQFLHEAAAGDFCFVETCSLAEVEPRIEAFILYRWNRSYPTDFYLDLTLTQPHWTQIETTDFAGNSHERITEEIYIPAKNKKERYF